MFPGLPPPGPAHLDPSLALSSIPYLCSQRDWRQTKGRHVFCYQDTKSLHLIKMCHGNRPGRVAGLGVAISARGCPRAAPLFLTPGEATILL